MSTITKQCPICGRPPENPRKVIRNGEIFECCVADVHDAYIVRPSNHATFVWRARKAGINGKA